MSAAAQSSSVDAAEVEKFSRIAAEWWDPRGKFAPLHRFNPVRLDFIAEQAATRFDRPRARALPFAGLSLLDIGCGGGLLSEPMARLGFKVTGVDASAKNVGVASAHAAESGLEIAYRNMTVEELLAEDADGGFDLVLNMEVIEHVADPGRFLRDASRLVKPGGLMIVATLNRTLKALATAKIGAEYILGWLPRGVHDWRKFLTPEELRLFLSSEPVAVQGPFGISYNPLADRWSLGRDASVNYMMTVERP
jgi:2-polyprenyl-6-hydroxyphenyl methylase / 3-demethylubiquinone-9 3-methyltransferase